MSQASEQIASQFASASTNKKIWGDLVFNVRTYGAVGDGVTDDSAAFQKAVDAAKNGGQVVVPPGEYLTTISIPYDNIMVVGSGRGTKIKAPANGSTLIKFSGSNGGVSDLTLDANGKSNVRGLAVVPQDEAQTTTLVHQNFNRFDNLLIKSCAEGIVLQAGPDVGGADSGCWYNVFDTIHVQYCTRGIWLKNPTNNGGSPCNRNVFRGVRVGQTGTNTGVQIDAGDTNVFEAVAFEGISTGTMPSATPTAVVIKEQANGGADNNSNRFLACSFEACTRDLENDNLNTELYGSLVGYGKLSGTVLPRFMLGNDITQSPLLLPGLKYGEGSLPAPYVNGVWNMEKDIVLTNSKKLYDAGKSWATHVLTTANCLNTVTIVEAQSKYQQVSGLIDWHFRLQFNASVAANAIEITLPVNPLSNEYLLHSSIAPMRFVVSVTNGSGVYSVVSADLTNHTVTPTRIKIPGPSGNWNTAGNNNTIWAQIQYKAN